MKQVISAYLSRLSPRERLIVVGGGLGAIVLVFWAFLVDPAFTEAKKLDRLTARKQGTAVELSEILADYRQLEAKMGEAASRPVDKNFSLLSFLEGLSSRARIKDNIKYMRPTTSDVTGTVREHSVEIKVAKVGLSAMVDVLTQVERAPHSLRVKKLHIKRLYSDPDLLDVTFVVARYEGL